MYLEKFAKSKEPFYLALGFRRPHMPFIAEKRYFDLYPWENIQLPPKQPGYKRPFSDEDQKKLIRGYYAAISFVDEQVGKVLKTLQETGLAENTLIVLIGDNGYALGERDGLFGKGELWDSNLKVSCIIVPPNQAKKSLQVDSVVSLTDLYPTIVDLAGLKRPGIQLEGQSMVQLLNGDSSGWRNTAVSHVYKSGWPFAGGAIRTDRWRYIENGDGSVELFDVKKDPWDWNNLANDPAYAGVVKELSAQVAESFKTAMKNDPIYTRTVNASGSKQP
jgi:arylsulfatase A-like enzyme